MSRTAPARAAAVLALMPVLLLAGEAAPQAPSPSRPLPPSKSQPQPRPAPRFTPRFEAVAETRLLMEGLNLPNYRGLERLLKDKPADPETWTFARGQALLIAEAGNLLLIRPPRTAAGQDAWFQRAQELRDAAAVLSRRTGARDFEGSRAAFADLTAACNRCHQTFRVAVRVGPAGPGAGPAPGQGGQPPQTPPGALDKAPRLP